MKRNLCLLLLLTLALSSSCRGKKAKLVMEVVNEPPTLVETEKANTEKTNEKPMEKQEEKEVQSNYYPNGFTPADQIEWKQEDTSPYKINWKEIKEEMPIKQNSSLIKVVYTEIHGIENTSSEKNLNQWIKDLIDKEILEYKKEVQPSNGYDCQYQSFLGKCEIMVLTPEICSILFDYSIACDKSNRSTKVLNVDLVNNRMFQSSDFFQPNVNYKKLLMDYCKADIKKQFEEIDQIKMGEQYTILLDLGCTEESCSDFVILSDGFYLVFDYIFSRADGRWTSKVPFSALGDSCLLKPVENAYGFFECPKGWKQIEKGGYRIKFPAVLDENKNIKNLDVLNDEDVQIDIPIVDVKILPSGKPSYFKNVTLLIQNRYFSELPNFKKDDLNYLSIYLTKIDGKDFAKNFIFKRVFDPDPSKRKIVDLWTFQEISTRSILSITITISYDYFSDWTEDGRPNESNEWKENEKKIYGQINQVFSTLHLH